MARIKQYETLRSVWKTRKLTGDVGASCREARIEDRTRVRLRSVRLQAEVTVARDARVSRRVYKCCTKKTELSILGALACSIRWCEIGLVITIATRF